MSVGTVHVGRSWRGNALEVNCPCPKEACGLVDMDNASDDCDQHRLTAAKTMRQMHYAHDCPASADIDSPTVDSASEGTS